MTKAERDQLACILERLRAMEEFRAMLPEYREGFGGAIKMVEWLLADDDKRRKHGQQGGSQNQGD